MASLANKWVSEIKVRFHKFISLDWRTATSRCYPALWVRALGVSKSTAEMTVSNLLWRLLDGCSNLTFISSYCLKCLRLQWLQSVCCYEVAVTLHRITEWFGLERNLGAQPSPTSAMGKAAPPSSGCPGPHPTWPWAPPGMGHHSFSGSCASMSEEFPPNI